MRRKETHFDNGVYKNLLRRKQNDPGKQDSRVGKSPEKSYL